MLADDVGDSPAFTRFVSIAPYTRIDRRLRDARTAFTFATDHRPGALFAAIEPFARAGLDLVRLVSRPLPATPWKYRFDAVVVGHPLDPAVQVALRELDAVTRTLRVVGVYEGHERSEHEPTDQTSVAAPEDPYVLGVRREISDLDRTLVELVNKRLKLVAQLKRYKDEHGIGFVDLAREEWMLQYLQRANRGPLSEDGLAQLYHDVLDLTKQELARQDDSSSAA